jgi:hypothetical protein
MNLAVVGDEMRKRRGLVADDSSKLSASRRQALPKFTYGHDCMARFSDLRLIRHDAAENWNVLNQGHTKAL